MARNYRLEIIEALGGQCQWHEGCDVADPDMLQIDHVHGGGNKHRQEFSWQNNLVVSDVKTRSFGPGWTEYYKGILSDVTTGDYQLLCANHNLKKHALERRAKKLAKVAV